MTEPEMIVPGHPAKQLTHVAVTLTSQEIITIRNKKILGVILLHFGSASMPRYNTEIQHTVSNLSLSCITTTFEEQLNLN